MPMRLKLHKQKFVQLKFLFVTYTSFVEVLDVVQRHFSDDVILASLWAIVKLGCQFASTRIQPLHSLLICTIETTYLCKFLFPPPVSLFFFFFSSDLWGPSQLSYLHFKIKQKQRNKSRGHVVNLIIPWLARSAKPASQSAKQASRPMP